MIRRSGFQLSFGIATLLFSTALHADATFRIIAVKHNPTCGRRGSPHFGERCGRNFECDSTPGQGDGLCIGGIVPTNTLNVVPGDTVVAEVFVSDWSPNGEGLRDFRFQFDLASFFDDCPGGITVYGWTNRREECVWCSEDDQCLDSEVCFRAVSENSVCYPPDHNSWIGIYSDMMNPGYPFPWHFVIVPVCETCTLTCADATIFPPGAVYDGTPKYLGTIVLSVLPESAGPYEVSLLAENESGNYATFARDSGGNYLAPFDLQPLTLVTPGTPPDCSGCPPLSADPPHCSIDARQPSEPNGSILPGSDSLSIWFDPSCYRVLDTQEFSIRQFPNDTPPRISSVDWDDATSTATIHFDCRISPQEWTCVTYTDRHPYAEFCVGYLPGDVDGNGSTNGRDVLSVIDNLNGVVDPPLAIWQCDVDRSGVCGSSDILRVIDLLNGADQYDIWLGATMSGECPARQ